jgi:hypothetical protein
VSGKRYGKGQDKYQGESGARNLTGLVRFDGICQTENPNQQECNRSKDGHH